MVMIPPSMMAIRAGARQVYACELSEAMVTMSRDTLMANGITEVTLLHASSTTLSIPRDLPERYSFNCF